MKNTLPTPQQHSVRQEYFSEGYPDGFPFPDMPLAIVDQGYDAVEAGKDTGLNRHEDFYALYVVRSGRGIHDLNGHPYSLKRGDVYFALPGSVHAYRDYGDLRAEAFCFQTEVFSAQQIEALRSLSGFWNLQVDESSPPAKGDTISRKHRLHLSPEQHHKVDAMIEDLRREVAQKNDNPIIARALIPQLFFQLLVYLARTHEAQGQSALPTAHDSGLAQVLRICDERFAEPLSVPQLAATMFLSPGRFSEVFSSQMGVAPATYLRRLRLERAQTLLRTTESTAARIAVEVGFADAAQFSRLFRSAFGLTPSDYRATFKK
jgi:AraC-like DNA-binding protein